jgi:hypothetical protein
MCSLEVRGAPKRGVVPGLQDRNQIEIKKKYRFCKWDNIKTYKLFALQPKSAIEFRWWLVHVY